MNWRFAATVHHLAEPTKLTSELTQFVARPGYALPRDQAPSSETSRWGGWWRQEARTIWPSRLSARRRLIDSRLNSLP